MAPGLPVAGHLVEHNLLVFVYIVRVVVEGAEHVDGAALHEGPKKIMPLLLCLAAAPYFEALLPSCVGARKRGVEGAGR